MKKLLAVILLASSALVPSFATGGAKQSPGVGIVSLSSVRTRATGSLMGARNSSDTVQQIGCTAANEIGYCYAVNAAGRTLSCSTSSPAMLQAMAAINASSNVSFEVETGTCKKLEVTNNSRYVADVGGSLQGAL